MDVITAISSRRSARRLVESAPSDEEFAFLPRIAAAAPGHGPLRPWRWILARGDARTAPRRGPGRRGRPPVPPVPHNASRPLRAVLAFVPRPGRRVPEWEQLLTTGSVACGLLLLLHARGHTGV